MPADKGEAATRLRIDKWLWQARFFKSRTLAASAVNGGGFRVNGTLIAKAHQMVGPEDVLTFPLGPHVRVIKVLALGTRRGPAPEARGLYEDLAPPQPKPRTPDDIPAAHREKGAGRPTKAERRAIDRLRGGDA
ncbi:MAG: RNA-binding S4 domain-containing protein [Rhodospirillales bacterium]